MEARVPRGNLSSKDKKSDLYIANLHRQESLCLASILQKAAVPDDAERDAAGWCIRIFSWDKFGFNVGLGGWGTSGWVERRVSPRPDRTGHL